MTVILRKLKSIKVYPCDITSCPILNYYGICTPIGNYGKQCNCPSQYEGDLCQYGKKNLLLNKNSLHKKLWIKKLNINLI